MKKQIIAFASSVLVAAGLITGCSNDKAPAESVPLSDASVPMTAENAKNNGYTLSSDGTYAIKIPEGMTNDDAEDDASIYFNSGDNYVVVETIESENAIDIPTTQEAVEDMLGIDGEEKKIEEFKVNTQNDTITDIQYEWTDSTTNKITRIVKLNGMVYIAEGCVELDPTGYTIQDVENAVNTFTTIQG